MLVVSALCALAPLPVNAGEGVSHPASNHGSEGELAQVLEVEVEDQTTRSTWRTRDRLLGDLGGLRPWLEGMGLSIEITSVDEGLGSPGESDRTGAARHYAGLTDLVLSRDTEAAGWWRGGAIVVDLQNVRGGDLSEVVGDLQGVSNIVGPPGTRLAEYHLVQVLAGGRVRVKLGKQDANADFVVSEGGGELVNSSFGLVPTVPLPTYPAPALGAMVAWSAHERVLVATGIWDGAPEVGSGCMRAFDGSGGTVSAVGLEVAAFGDAILPGT